MSRIYACLMFLVLFFSCEDDITIKIPDSNNKFLVVDGIMLIDPKNSNPSIGLSYFNNYESSDTLWINNANIYLLSNAQDTIKFSQDPISGRYLANKRLLKAGYSYKLCIHIEDKQYESNFQSVLAPVEIDSLALLSNEYLSKNGYLFDPLIYQQEQYLAATFKDPPTTSDCYLWTTEIYSYALTHTKVLCDKDFNNGIQVPFEYLWFDRDIRKGQQVFLIQYAINKNTYDYIEALKNLTSISSPFSTPPSNPISNINCLNNPNETVLGFFDISIPSVKSIMVE